MILFNEAFNSGGVGSYRECEGCGRVYFDADPESGWDWDWDDGELQRLFKLEQEKPDKFISTDGAVSSIIINGMYVVMDCECEVWKEFKEFIDTHAIQVAEYLNSLSRVHARRSQQLKVE